MRRSLSPAAAAVVASTMLVSIGCGSPEPLGHSSLAMVNGMPSPTGSEEDAVLLLRATEPELMCTGTLVAPNLLLTTRHCVATPAAATSGFLCTLEGELVSPEPGAGTLGADLPPESLEVYGPETPRTTPLAIGKQIVSSNTKTMCLDDIAFVVLDRELSLPTLPIRVVRPPLQQEPITLVGYGLVAADESPDLSTQERLRLPDRAVKWIGPQGPSGGIDAPPRMFVIDGPASCHGDSGGPAIAQSTSAVIGVFSLIAGDCETPGVDLYYTQTSPFEELALQAFVAAGAEPNFEPEPLVLPPPLTADPPANSEPEAPSCSAGTRQRENNDVVAALLLVTILVGARRRSS